MGAHRDNLVLRRADRSFDLPGKEGGDELSFALNIINTIGHARTSRRVNEAHANLQFSKAYRAQSEGEAARVAAQAKFLREQTKHKVVENEAAEIAAYQAAVDNLGGDECDDTNEGGKEFGWPTFRDIEAAE